jgi:ribose transport system permease protein
VIGSFIGSVFVVLINKVLREGLPITRTLVIDGQEVQVQAVFSLPAGAVPVFIGVLLIVAVLIEPLIIRRQLIQRLWAYLRGAPPPPAPDSGGVAIEGAQTKGSMAADKALTARGMGKFFARRDALAISLTVLLWLVGLYLRPDYWWNLPNTFAILLNYTELALISIGLTYVIAAGDIDLSVGAVLALAGSTAAYALKVLGLDPLSAMVLGFAAGTLAGFVNGALTVWLRLPSFIATLGMFYIARGLASWLVSGQQLTGWNERYNLIGRKVGDILSYLGLPHPSGFIGAVTEVVSVQTLWMMAVAVLAGVVLAFMPFGQKIYATGGNIRAAAYAGINTDRIRFIALVFCAVCATMAGLINIAYFRSFNPVAGQFRELDGIAAVIIGGGSIFGGYGTVIGALAGAAVITLIRALLQLNVEGFTMPQHWINVFVGAILIIAVLIDIWVRQASIFSTLRELMRRPSTARPEAAHV